ncbi:MAG: NAD(P)-dependent alcohol dehydrogenase [Lactobacillaceae bacterium]|jgi:aryl-alcohol dehydrogenase|nr:NAD(P)-dependent alcohol dehydrogenase [Lactobacillaceae bacterium]
MVETLVKAAVVNQVAGDFQIEELRLGELSTGEVRVHLVASGICHSDEEFRLGHTGDHLFPGVFGHEGAGIVEEVGEGVKSVKPGDHVVMSFASCGVCDNCISGHPASCIKFGELNFSGVRPNHQHTFTKMDGTGVMNVFQQSSFSTETITQESNLTVVPKHLDLRYFGPLGCGFVTGSGTILNTLKPKPGQSIAVFGSGAVGLAAIMAAKISGATTIIAINRNGNRLDIARDLGATHTIDNVTEDSVEAIMRITNGKGVDFTVDTTGNAGVIKDSILSLATDGVAAPVAVSNSSFDFNPFDLLLNQQKSVVGVAMGNAVPQITIKKLIDFYEKDLYPFDKLVKFYKLDEINQANADSNSGKVVKPVMIIDEDYVPGE